MYIDTGYNIESTVFSTSFNIKIGNRQRGKFFILHRILSLQYADTYCDWSASWSLLKSPTVRSYEPEARQQSTINQVNKS